MENLIGTVEEATEKRCCELTEDILKKKDKLIEQSKGVSEATVEKVNQMVESRIEQLKKDIPQVLDYAKMKKLERCMDTIKECVGYNADEQVERVAKESAKMLNATKTLMETQAKQISEKAASLNESAREVSELKGKIRQMQLAIEAKEKQIVESTKKNVELVNDVQNLQRKVEESKKINENLEEKRRSEALKFYLEEKISKYPKYEADLLRKHFKEAKSRAEIDENFQKALSMVAERRDAMRTVQAIPVSKVASPVVPTPKLDNGQKQVISGETIVRESGGKSALAEPYDDDSFVDIDLDNDKISPEDMQRWMDRL